MGRAAFKAVEVRNVPGGFDSYLFRQNVNKHMAFREIFYPTYMSNYMMD